MKGGRGGLMFAAGVILLATLIASAALYVLTYGVPGRRAGKARRGIPGLGVYRMPAPARVVATTPPAQQGLGKQPTIVQPPRRERGKAARRHIQLPPDSMVTFAAERKAAAIDDVFAALDRELIGLVPVKKLQVMENQRDKLVVILAGYKDRMDIFFQSNPGMRSRIAHHLDFADYDVEELVAIGRLMLERANYYLSDPAEAAFREYVRRRMHQPLFANARSVRNELERARLRHAHRLAADQHHHWGRDDLMRIEAEDILPGYAALPVPVDER